MFLPYPDAFKKEADYRDNIDFSKLCKFGIKPLDDALRAIAPKELIVIAAGSGYGKTELALAISRYNALRGKRVAHYNLEGGAGEAVNRITWRDICDSYYSSYTELGLDMDYRKWVLNEEPSKQLMRLAAEAYIKAKDEIGENLLLYHSHAGLTCEGFCESLKSFHSLTHVFDEEELEMRPEKMEIDLVVVDHIHYFRYGDEKEEIKAMTEIMQTCKDMTERYDIPVIMVAHLRKLARGHGIPDKEDIYGTSNIHKIANTCLIIVPDHEKHDIVNRLYPTFIRVAKSRQGLQPNILINSTFDGTTRQYKDKYALYRCGPNGDVAADAVPIEQCPKWARGIK